MSARVDTILLATDLSQASSAATDQAVELAARLDARLVFINVIDERRTPDGTEHHARLDQVRARREEAMIALTADAGQAGARADFLVWAGDVGRSIVAAAAAERADIVVVGSRGRDRTGRFLLGSVSDHVVRNAQCPVLVARPVERTEPSGPGGTFASTV